MDSIYESYTHSICEIFSKPAKYKWGQNNNARGVATFQAGDLEIEVAIEQIFGGEGDIDVPGISDIHEFTFSAKNPGSYRVSYDLTGKGNAFTIFSTVLAIAEEYIRKHNRYIQHFGFVADKKLPGETSRSKLYTTMFKKISPAGDWEKKIFNGQKHAPNAKIFILENNKYNV